RPAGPARGWLRNLSIRNKIRAIVVVFSVAIVCLVVVIALTFNVAAGVRGYIRGEGLWSKGQKDGVYWLMRYVRTQDEQDYERYLESMRLPLGDRDARIELSKREYDPALVQRGFLEGGNSPEDIPFMITLFRRFGGTSPFTPALEIWSEADRYLLLLRDCGDEVHRAIRSGVTPAQQEQLLQRLDQLNINLTRLETEFSADFGNAAHALRSIMARVILVAAGLLLFGGLVVSWAIWRGMEAAIQGLRDGALRVAAGDLTHQIPVGGGDELGQLAGIFNDMVRQRHQVEDALRGATEFQALVMQSATNAIYVLDRNGCFTMANQRTSEVTGYSAEQLLGMPYTSLVAPEQADDMAAKFSDILINGNSLRHDEATVVRADGTRVIISYSAGPLYRDGVISAVVGTAEDITERKRVEAFIRHSAQHDALTGLPNRALLLDRLDMAMRQSRRHDSRVAVLMIDLDHFKQINDTLGHQFGDRLLLEVSERLKQAIRDVDTVSRLGGDEFVIVLTEVESRGQLEPLVAKITEAVATPVTIDGHELLVTASIGGCFYPEDGGDTGALLKHADAAMYQAKAAGRSNIQWFTHAMLQDTVERLALGSALRRAVENRELTLHYQPEICLKSGRMVGMEALTRWKHPERGYIAPSRFISVAEDTGQIIPLGEWVLHTACSEAVRIQRHTGRPLVMAVNVSPRQFQQPEWLQVVQSALQQSGLAPQHLELEITEGMLMRNPEESAALLRRLRALGVTVVIDDFGTGYSSLAYLTRFPIDKIKIDRSFVRDLASDAADAAVVKAIIAMARSLNIRVIAEGVETQAQQVFLRERGCDEAQGFYYSAAVPIEHFMSLAA
ncbi:MAG: EAL domain-containing protein, partial [Nevskia sp.]|nr:EAL domain-containing protein [Nevskia sp.]